MSISPASGKRSREQILADADKALSGIDAVLYSTPPLDDILFGACRPCEWENQLMRLHPKDDLVWQYKKKFDKAWENLTSPMPIDEFCDPYFYDLPPRLNDSIFPDLYIDQFPFSELSVRENQICGIRRGCIGTVDHGGQCYVPIDRQQEIQEVEMNGRDSRHVRMSWEVRGDHAST